MDEQGHEFFLSKRLAVLKNDNPKAFSEGYYAGFIDGECRQGVIELKAREEFIRGLHEDIQTNYIKKTWFIKYLEGLRKEACTRADKCQANMTIYEARMMPTAVKYHKNCYHEYKGKAECLTEILEYLKHTGDTLSHED